MLRSAGVRLALGYALVFGISAAMLILVLWISGINILTRQVDAAIDADEQGLAEQWKQGGPEALFETIQSRIASNADNDSIYLVLDPKGDVVAGNLDSWPDQVSKTGQVYEISVNRNGKLNQARFHRYDLPAGYALLVGREVSSRVALRTLLAEVLAWSMVLIGLLSVAGAILLKKLFGRMVSQVSQTADAISSGDLTRRVAISGRGDEFDRMAETINDMLDRLNRLMDGVRQVSNAIAHDLRTPITRARARLEDASMHAGSAEQLRSAIDRAVSDLDGITNVFHALLRISEIEAGARRSAFVRLDLRPLLDDLRDLYGAAAEERGLSLTLSAPAELPALGDRELIQQAVANLLDNAIKFSPRQKSVEIVVEQTADTMMLAVRDHGAGIPVGDVSRATERFFRGEAARNTPGFGLGLTLVRAVAQLHGGTLELQDANPGLRATLVLPRASELRAGRGASPRAEAEGGTLASAEG
ncbi:MAG: HAMP domain-containing sensor histidine kinase [Acetobacteraceae bacterium]|nr:HAMP domain-containing sensor histidine kinase [Acetobacteraceae bacterium]